MTGALRRWRELDGGQRRQLMWMMLALPVVDANLRIAGYVRTRRWLERMSRNEAPHRASPTEMDASISATRIAAIAGRRGPVAATCLRQSLLLFWLLRRRGLAPELKLGVLKQDGAVDAHAWVELEGQSLDPQPIAHQAFSGPRD